jgi:hypothetical protein
MDTPAPRSAQKEPHSTAECWLGKQSGRVSPDKFYKGRSYRDLALRDGARNSERPALRLV